MSDPKSSDYVGNLWQDFRQNKGLDMLALSERFYLRYVTELAINRFKWSGLPEKPEGDLRPRYMELVLFRKALVVFFKHSGWGKYLCMQATTPGHQDMYYDPTAFHIYGNGSTPGIDGLTVSAKDAVPIWANYLRAPDLDMVSIYVRRMAQFDRTVDINVAAMKHPFLLFVDDQNKQSVMNAFRMVEEGQPVIILNKAMGGAEGVKDMMNVFDMKLDPDLITNLLIDKRKVWNELLTFLGINNANQDKRERLVQSEVTANDSEVLAARAIALDARQEAADAINDMFGLNVKVEWNTKIDAMGDMPALMIPHSEKDMEGKPEQETMTSAYGHSGN